MFKDEFKAVVNGGVGKINFLKNNLLDILLRQWLPVCLFLSAVL